MARFSLGQLQTLWINAGGPSDVAALMSAIAMAESSGNSDAVNPGFGAGGRRTNEYSVGLWQINTLVHRNYTREQLKDPAINAREAVRIYRVQGLRAWGSYTDGRYRQYLNDANATTPQIVNASFGFGETTNDMALIVSAAALVALLLATE